MASRHHRGILSGGAPVIAVEGDEDFGSTVIQTPVSEVFTIENTGTRNLIITAINVPDGFTLINTSLPMVIAAGDSDEFEVEADADAIGGFTGDVSITNNSATNPYEVEITVTVTNVFTETFDSLNPAVWDETDADGIVSVSGGELIFDSGGAGGVNANYLRSVQQFAPVAGDAIVWQVGAISGGGVGITRFGNNAIGVSDAQAEISSTLTASYWRPVSAFIQLRQAWADGDWAAWVFQSGRSTLLHRPNLASPWKLVFTTPFAHPDFGQVNAKIALQRGAAGQSARWKGIDYTKLTPSLHDPEYSSGGSVSAGTVLPLPADGFIEITRTLTVGQVIEQMFRRESDTDTLQLKIDQAASGTVDAVRIDRIDGGSPVLVNRANITINAATAYRFILRYVGTAIDFWFEPVAGGSKSVSLTTTSTHNQTVAGGKLATGTVDDVKAWEIER